MIEQTQIVKASPKWEDFDLSPPKEGETEREQFGKRFAWDDRDKTWRWLNHRHCPEHINPFHNYTPVPPFRLMPGQASDKTVKEFYSDGNGVRITKESHQPNRYVYSPVSNLRFLGKNLMRGPRAEQAEQRRMKKMGNALCRVAMKAKGFEQFFDESGQPKHDLVTVMYIELAKAIFAQPEIIAAYADQIRNKAKADPLATLKELKQLTGQNVNIMSIATSGNQFIKLDVFNAEPEDDNQIEGSVVEPGDDGE